VSGSPKTIRAVVEYDGTDFCGLQYQPPPLRSIAAELESVLAKLFHERIKITAAGRTDAGVHATGQVISFRCERDFPLERLTLALNANLPPDISVRESHVAADDFSARFSAFERRYVYHTYHAPMRSALAHRFAHHFYGSLDLEKMRTAAAALVGEHDFRSFCGELPERGPTVRTVQAIDIEERREFIVVNLRADGFLRHMARTIVGTLLEVGNARRQAGGMHDILAARSREAAGPTAPAHGLYLAGVRYADLDSFKEPLLLA